jgi:hypothetical protein
MARWRVDIIRKRAEHLGTVEAASEKEAIDKAAPTCRKRLQRGEAFAYFAGLSADQRRAEREYHAAREHLIDSKRGKEAG